jgi:hypothetical protein
MTHQLGEAALESLEFRGVLSLGEVFERHRAVVDVALNDGDLLNTLQALAREACELLAVGRCSVFLRDTEAGGRRFQGYAAYAMRDVDAVPRMTCGVEADRMTPEIIQTGKPLFIRDAPNDGRPVRSAMLRYNVRDILGVPMVAAAETVGLLFLDEPGQPRRFTAAEQSRIATLANLCAPTIEHLRQLAGVETALGALKRDVAALRRIQAIDARFRRLDRAGGTARDVVKLVTELTRRPCVICTRDCEELAREEPEGSLVARFPVDVMVAGDPAVAADLQALSPASAGVLGPYPHRDVRSRSLISVVTVSGTRWGYFALLESVRRFTAVDKFLVERAAQYLAAELRRGCRTFAPLGEGSRGAAVVADAALMAQSAAERGSSGDVLRLVCLLQRRDGKPWDCVNAAVFEEAFDRAAGSVKTIGLPDGKRGITLITEHGPAAEQDEFVESTRSALHAILQSDIGRGLAAVMSTTCRRPDDLARAHMECRQLMKCVLELCPADSPPLAAGDLGVGRLLLGSSDAFAMNRFATAALGSLLVDDERHRELLTTLHVFLESGRSPRNAGRALYVHENTVRYRLARVFELTGLDVSADLNDQLTVQVALLILRLQGRLPDVDFYGRLVRSGLPDDGLPVAACALAVG